MLKSEARARVLRPKLHDFCIVDGDNWACELVTTETAPGSLIGDSKEKVTLYLANIKMLWGLGSKPIQAVGTRAQVALDLAL